MARVPMAPDAVFCLEQPACDPGGSGATLFFFKDEDFFCWDVASDRILPGYPRPIRGQWPGLLEAFGGAPLRGALHVPAWGPLVCFFARDDDKAVLWNLASRSVESSRIAREQLLPSRLAKSDFTPVYATLPRGEPVVYAFSGREYTRWTIRSSMLTAEDEGFPRSIEADWKDGLVLAPRSGVYVDWPNRSSAHSNRKLYFFMGDLYLRWDVPTHTRNYRLDILSGWKGWPAGFEVS